MKYLILDADFKSTGIRDILGKQISSNDLKLSEQLWSDIELWVKNYSVIVPLSNEDRIKLKSEIRELDIEGFNIKSRILKELEINGIDAKIEYYSEGCLKKIHSIKEII